MATIIFTNSKMADGNMKTEFGELEAIENRKKFWTKNGIDGSNTVFMNPQHKDRICKVTSQNAGKIMLCDGLYTEEKNIPLAFTPADCLPIFFFGHGFIALVHAGRQGTLEKIVKKMLNLLLDKNNNDLINIHFGPAIGPCCYHFPVNPDLTNWGFRFSPNIETIYKKKVKHFTVDLMEENIYQLKKIARERNAAKIINIQETTNQCTYCFKEAGEYKYFSHLREGKKRKGANMAIIVRV